MYSNGRVKLKAYSICTESLVIKQNYSSSVFLVANYIKVKLYYRSTYNHSSIHIHSLCKVHRSTKSHFLNKIFNYRNNMWINVLMKSIYRRSS